MAIEFTLPDLGENVSSGDVVTVLVREGDVIRSGQGVIEMETDKAVVEVPCPHAGRVAKVHVSEGETVRVGSPVLTLEESAAVSPPPARTDGGGAQAVAPAAKVTPASPKRQAAKGPTAPPRPAALPTAASAPAPHESTAPAVPFRPRGQDRPLVAAGPALRRLARELGVDINDIRGTGPGGRVTREDIEQAAKTATPRPPLAEAAEAPASAPAGVADRDRWGPIRREALTQIRKTIAAHMVKAASAIPHVTHIDDADVTDLDRVRRSAHFEDLDPPVKVTMLSFVIKAVACSLKSHPPFNASFDAENEQVIYKDYVHVGVAVDTDRGLIVPVVRNADGMSVLEIARAVSAVAEEVRSGHFDLDLLRGGTFTVSNVGAFGGLYSTPIIHHPEVAILLVGRARMQPVYVHGSFEPRLMLPLSLSYDHRVLDGAMAAQFMNEIIEYLESPGRLLLAT